MNPSQRVFASLSLVCLVAACGDGPAAPAGPPAELAALPRALTAAEVTVRDAANAFSFALWQRVNERQHGENVFLSPLSASFALGMTLNGAAGQTFDEMRDALQFGAATQSDINAGYRSLIALLTSLDPAVQTGLANSIWYRDGFPVLPTFLDAGRTFFDAEVAGLDFADPASLTTINNWVSDKTHTLIPTILEEIQPDNVMFLINAIYFNGQWREKFDPAETRQAPFHAAGGSTETASLMHRTGTMSYAETAEWQAVDLPYGNSAFTMTVLLPSQGTDIDAFAEALTPARWAAITGAFTPREVALHLPKLKMSYERTLNADLQALGMFVPFGSGADFTNLSPQGRDLFIDFVKQKAFVEIDEAGTKAAAATVVVISETSAPQIHEVRVDRPYVFALRERLSGTVLFLGKIVRMPSGH